MSELLVSPSYILSKWPAGTVLVNRHTGEIYKPQEVFQAYPSWGHDTAANHLKRMLKVKPDLVDHDLVKSFFNWGGNRAGAGRPNRGKAKRQTMSISVDASTKDYINAKAKKGKISQGQVVDQLVEQLTDAQK